MRQTSAVWRQFRTPIHDYHVTRLHRRGQDVSSADLRACGPRARKGRRRPMRSATADPFRIRSPPTVGAEGDRVVETPHRDRRKGRQPYGHSAAGEPRVPPEGSMKRLNPERGHKERDDGCRDQPEPMVVQQVPVVGMTGLCHGMSPVPAILRIHRNPKQCAVGIRPRPEILADTWPPGTMAA